MELNHQKFPKDERFKSVSAFYNYVMENSLNIFEQGKTFDDLEKVVDSELKGFMDNFSFRAVIPFFENIVEPNRYTGITYNQIPDFLLALREFYLKNLDPYSINSLKKMVDRMKNLYTSNKLTKTFNFEFITENDRKNISAIFEYVGSKKNITYEYCKGFATFFGLLGMKIEEFLYSEKELYSRIKVKSTELFFEKDVFSEERVELINHNLNFMVNYSNIINDNDYYLWMKLVEDKNLLVSFNNIKVMSNWLKRIENDFDKYDMKKKFLLNILKFFEKLHWIDIESEKDLIFQIRLNVVQSNREREFLMEYLSKYSEVSQIDQIFQLIKKS